MPLGLLGRLGERGDFDLLICSAPACNTGTSGTFGTIKRGVGDRGVSVFGGRGIDEEENDDDDDMETIEDAGETKTGRFAPTDAGCTAAQSHPWKDVVCVASVASVARVLAAKLNGKLGLPKPFSGAERI